MIRQFEWLARKSVTNGLNLIRATPAYLDEMFPDLSAASRAQMKTWLLRTEIPFILAWPRGIIDNPLWSLTLAAEDPTYKPIGMTLDSANPGSGIQESRGEFVRKLYQIHTIAPSPDVTITLSAILQHILKSMVQSLDQAGFHEMRTAQQDALDIRQDLLPNSLYVRTTSISVLVEDSFVYVDTQGTSVVVGDAGPMNDSGAIEVVFPS